MTEQPTTPPPAGRTPTLGRGLGRWSAHIDGDMPPTEPYQPKPRPRPAAGWPKSGTVGASTTLGADEQPVTVPGRPYVVIHRDAARVADGIARLEWPADTARATEAHRGLFARAIGWFRR